MILELRDIKEGNIDKFLSTDWYSVLFSKFSTGVSTTLEIISLAGEDRKGRDWNIKDAKSLKNCLFLLLLDAFKFLFHALSSSLQCFLASYSAFFSSTFLLRSSILSLFSASLLHLFSLAFLLFSQSHNKLYPLNILL